MEHLASGGYLVASAMRSSAHSLAMQLGVIRFATDYSIGIADLAKAVEEQGFESIFLTEHTSRRADGRHGPAANYLRSIGTRSTP